MYGLTSWVLFMSLRIYGFRKLQINKRSSCPVEKERDKYHYLLSYGHCTLDTRNAKKTKEETSMKH